MEIIHVVLGKESAESAVRKNKDVQELASRQALAGEQVALWRIVRIPDENLTGQLFPIRMFRAYENPFRLDPALKIALGEKREGTIFHLHGGFIPLLSSLARELRRRDIPYVFTPHGSYNVRALNKSKWGKRLYLRWFERPLLQHAVGIHCLGKSETSGLQLVFPNQKTHLIPYGHDVLPEQAHVPIPAHFILGFCGRIDIQRKGLDVLLNAFSRFAREVSGTELWIIGDSAEMLDLQDLAEDLHISRDTLFLGSLYGEEKLDLFRRVDAFVFPSRNEGLPTSVLEAAALGIPCIVTEATNTGDLFRRYRCGEVIPEPETEALYEAMRRIYKTIQGGGWAALHQNARRMIWEAYNWNAILKDFQRMYNFAS